MAFDGKSVFLTPDSAVLVGASPGGKAEVSALRGELNILGAPAPPVQPARKDAPPGEKRPGETAPVRTPDAETPVMHLPEWHPPPSSPWQDLLAPKAPACTL
ncbi:MAG: hypothetical protein AAB576_07690, partial [Elusimicrobiota bacterium]